MRPVGWNPLGTATHVEAIKATVGFHVLALAIEAGQRACAWCAGRGWVLEPSAVGLMPVMCECRGRT